MDSLRPHTTPAPHASSAIDGVLPCHISYRTSDSSADSLLAAPHTIRKDSIRDLPHPAGFSGQCDRVSISREARRLYDACASGSASHPAAAPIGLVAENIVLYNQIRRERDALPPGDPRVMELTEKLQTLLMAGDKALNAEDMDYRTPPAIQVPDQAAPQSRLAGPLPDSTMSKNRQDRHFTPYSQDSGDVAGFSFTLPYPSPDASTEATPFSAHASASASLRIHRAESGTLEHVAGLTPPRRMYRVA